MSVTSSGASAPAGASDLEVRTRELGRRIFSGSGRHARLKLSRGYLSEKMLQWSMHHQDFKVEAFRFVDVLPTLTASDEVIAHLKEYFLDSTAAIPFWIRSGIEVATSLTWAEDFTAKLVRKNVTGLAHTFITGENAADAAANLRRIWSAGGCFTVDILGEAVVAEAEAIEYQQRYIELIKGLSDEVKRWPANPVLENSPLGLVPRANVSVKCSSLYSQIDPLAYRHSVEQIKSRLRPILQVARQRGVFVNLDMEQNDYREIFLGTAEELFTEKGLDDYPHFGIVIQAYLKCAERDLDRVIACACSRGAPLTVRLVKGAYWDYEVIQARQRGWEPPVFTVKAQSDANFEKLAGILIKTYPYIIPAFGSHNVRSLAHAMAAAEKAGLEKTAIEVQMLYGMADTFKTAVKNLGYRVRDYAPVGQILPGMAYLVRRLLENTSNESFLKVKYMKTSDALKLLEQPSMDNPVALTLCPDSGTLPAQTMTAPVFQNAPPLDFSIAENRLWIDAEFRRLRARLPLNVNPMIGGNEIAGTPVAQWANPGDLREIVTKYTMANQYHADLALKECEKAKTTWGKFTQAERSRILRETGNGINRRRKELIALIALETGKHVREADADVCEAVDFCRYYADQAETLFAPFETAGLPGESNRYGYRPRGTAVAIAPWNFPLAILTGMTVGPLACGNPVIMKPAEQSTGIALPLYQELISAGVPAEAVHLLPGAGEIVGDYLVNHSQTHIITFTGSKAVGLTILRNAYKPLPGQTHIKKVVAELGGKNGIIIDADADLDEAVLGAIPSVFGFQGQKCSACSRLIVLESVYEKFKRRFIEAMLSLKIGRVDELTAKVGPVIDEDAKERIMDVINRHRGKITAQLTVPPELIDRGHFVPPTVFEDTDFGAELGQREFFGPLVTLFKARHFDEAVEALNGVDYALTAGLYSRTPSHLKRARTEIQAGNLYLNRGCTGALVGRQPFGGFKLSGAGAKAGGPDYLTQFVEPVTITENTMRRGFAPEM